MTQLLWRTSSSAAREGPSWLKSCQLMYNCMTHPIKKTCNSWMILKVTHRCQQEASLSQRDDRATHYVSSTKQVSAATDRHVVQWLMPTVLYTDVDGHCGKLVTETVTSLPHWPSTYVDSTWADQPFQRYGWCSPKFKFFTWPDHAPFRNRLPSMSCTVSEI